MRDNQRANELYQKGMSAWEELRYEDAASLFREAISLAEPGYFLLDQFYGALGQVLSSVGKADDARKAFESALNEALLQNDGNTSPPVVTARYFLAEHLLENNEPSQVLFVTEPSIGIGTRQEGLLQLVRAIAFERLGDTEESRKAAMLAIELARSEKQRNNFREQLKNILEL